MELSFIVNNKVVSGYVAANILRNFDEFRIGNRYSPIPYSFVLSERKLLETIADNELESALRRYQHHPDNEEAYIITRGLYSNDKFRAIDSLLSELNRDRARRIAFLDEPIHEDINKGFMKTYTGRDYLSYPQTNLYRNRFRPLSKNSDMPFFGGLTPEELFFLQAGHREGLLDTAINTHR